MDGPQGGGKEGGEEAEGGGAGAKRAHTWLHEGGGLSAGWLVHK